MIGQFFYFLALLAVVGALAWISAKLMSSAKKGRLGRGRALEVVESLPLGPHASLSIVRAGSRWCLVGATKESVSMLATLDEEEIRMLPQAEGSKSLFESRLSKLLGKGGKGA
jgi:flagellar biosynthetic protein FliO